MCLFQLCSCAFKSVRGLVVCTCFGVRSFGVLTWMCFPFLPVKEQQVTSRDKLNASHFFLLVFFYVWGPTLGCAQDLHQALSQGSTPGRACGTCSVGMESGWAAYKPGPTSLSLLSGGKCLIGVSSVSLCKHLDIYLQEFTPGSDLIAETHHLPFPVTS